MNRYPTDEELEQLIQNLEQQELYAPAHLKDEILTRAFPKQTVEVLPKSKSSDVVPISKGKVVSLFSYRLKIVVGMAVAIIMLAIIPIQSGGNRQGRDNMNMRLSDLTAQQETKAEEEKIDVKNVLNKSTREMNQKMNILTDHLSNLLNVSLGGYENEN